MDAVTLINENLDVVKLLEHYDFDGINPQGDMVRAKCKIHGGINASSFVISEETGLWYCHAGICGGGDAIKLVRKLDNVGFPEAVQKLADLFGLDIQNMEINERPDQSVAEIKKWMKTMSSWKERERMAEFTLGVPIKEVKKFRNFLPETLQHFQLGFVEKVRLERRSAGQYELTNRLVIPIVQDGVRVGVSFRKVKANDYPKWSHQPVHIKVGDLLYNYDATVGEMEVVICEGAFDVWAYHEIGVTAVATYGAHITDEQYRLLMKTGANLVFSYDGDDPGREATRKGIALFRNKANMSTVPFDEGEDPASVSREQLKLKYESRGRV